MLYYRTKGFHYSNTSLSHSDLLSSKQMGLINLNVIIELEINDSDVHQEYVNRYPFPEKPYMQKVFILIVNIFCF